MDIQLIIGPNNSGKSLFAEDLAVQNTDSPLIYLATMVPQNEENDRRIEKHKRQRDGKGFTTIEEPWNIHEIEIPADSVVLLEDASNLLSNGIFIYRSNADESFRRILALANRCKKLIIVSIGGMTSGEFDEETNNYIDQINHLNEMLTNSASYCKKF